MGYGKRIETQGEEAMKNTKTRDLFNNSDLGSIETSLRTRVRLYKKRAHEIERYLKERPGEWGRFQSEFNAQVDSFFRDIMDYEKKYMTNGHREKVQRLKDLFVRRIKYLFGRGLYCEWSIRKPYGYSGDFKIIDYIYQNSPSTSGFDRLFDNYYQMSAICVAVRNRKEDFKRMIADFVNSRKDRSLRIMNLGSGPCREIKEIFEAGVLKNKDVAFDCYDNEQEALDFAKGLLNGFSKVNFIKENALRMAAAKDINLKVGEKYDLIYAMGLFDYFNHKVSVRMIHNLKKLLKKEGMLVICNVRDKYSNPSVHFMEWAGGWELVYRTDEEFRQIFIEAGFKSEELEIQYEQQGIMQYIIASNIA